MKKSIINDKLVFYSGLIYFVIMLVFVGIRILSMFGLLDFPGSSILFKIIIQCGLMFFVPVVFYKLFMKKSFKQTFVHFGFKRTTQKSIWLSILAGFCLYFLIMYFSSIWSALLSLIGYKFSSSTSSYSVLEFILSVLLIGLLPAICEETTHRGLVLNGMKHNGGIRAIVLTGLLFGLMHFNIVQFGYAFLVGMIFCIVTMVSRSIIPAMIMHFMNNFLSLFISYSINSTWLKNGVVDFVLNMFTSSSFLTTFIIRILIILLCFYGICWCIAKLFKEGKKLDYFYFKKNLRKEIEKNGLQKEIDINNDVVVFGLYREVNMLNLEKQLQEQKISFREILSGNTKKATEIILSDKMAVPQKPVKRNYIFFYASIILGAMGTIATLILGLV